MNNINPLYLLLFFTSVALFMIYQTSNMEKKTAYVIQQNTTLEKSGQYVKTLKDRWKNPKESQKRIDAVLALREFKAKVTQKSYKKGIYHIELKELSSLQLDKFNNKILNESVSIKKMSLLRNADKTVTLIMEFIL